MAGLNGLGVKLTNIFSDSFRVRVRHAATGDSYEQRWTDQMGTVGDPVVRAGSKPMAGFVEVTFKPVAALLGAAGAITDDARGLLLARAMEVALAAPKATKVHFNGTALKCDTLKKYIDTIYPADDSSEGARFVAVDEADPNWVVGVVHAAHAATHGLVNGVGANAGQHVAHVRGRLMPAIVEAVKAKRGDKGGAVSAASLDAHAAWFVVARVNRPAFDSQCKEKLVSCERLSDYTPAKAFVDKIAGSPIAAAALEDERMKTSKKLARATDGKKVTNVSVPKLYDASWAGGARSKECMLILTEGMSALAFAIAGRSAWGADRVGCFPLKGKPLNAREASAEALAKNEEAKHINTILGLKAGEDSAAKLRYGSVVILSDSDADGSHIRGLIITLFHSRWPALAKSGFLRVLPTPLIVARKGATAKEFMSTAEFDSYAAAHDMRGHSIKYFKVCSHADIVSLLKLTQRPLTTSFREQGLGSWTSADAKAIFNKTKPVAFVDTDNTADTALEMAFAKSKTHIDARKQWIIAGTASPPVAESYRANVPIGRFVHSDLLLFSIYSVQRAIPSITDGLKIAQRKIMHVTLTRGHTNRAKEAKVAQLAAAVAADTLYIHGETSLQDAIVCLAQSFAGKLK